MNYPVGFSNDEKIAYIEHKEGGGKPVNSYRLIIQDLITDKILWDSGFLDFSDYRYSKPEEEIDELVKVMEKYKGIHKSRLKGPGIYKVIPVGYIINPYDDQRIAVIIAYYDYEHHLGNSMSFMIIGCNLFDNFKLKNRHYSN